MCSFKPSSNPVWPAVICVYHRWDFAWEVVAEDFGGNFGTKKSTNLNYDYQTFLNCTGCWQLGVAFVLPCHVSTSIQLLCHCQGSRNCSEKSQEHIKLSQALHHLFGCRTQIQSLRTLRPDWHFSSTLQLPVQSILLSVKEVLLLFFFVGVTEGFGQNFSDTSQFAVLSQKDVVWLSNPRHNWKIQVISHHFLSLIAIPCWCLVANDSSDLFTGTKTTNTMKGIQRLHSGPLLDSGHPPSHRRWWNLGRIVFYSQSSRHCQRWCGLVFDLNKVVLYDVWLLVTVLAAAASRGSRFWEMVDGGYGLRKEPPETICSPLWSNQQSRKDLAPVYFPADTMPLPRSVPWDLEKFHCLYLIHHYPPMVVWKRWGQPHFKENRCSILCKLAHPSQNQFVNVERNKLHLEVTPRPFEREPLTGTFPKFQCTFEAFQT